MKGVPASPGGVGPFGELQVDRAGAVDEGEPASRGAHHVLGEAVFALGGAGFGFLYRRVDGVEERAAAFEEDLRVVGGAGHA